MAVIIDCIVVLVAVVTASVELMTVKVATERKPHRGLCITKHDISVSIVGEGER